MDLGKLLIERKRGNDKHNWKGLGMSVIVHGILLGTFIFLSLSAAEQVVAHENAIPVYLSQAAAPPPPPPPPPPAGTPARSQPQVQPKIEPIEVPQDTFVQPQEMPEEIPVVDTPVVETPAEPGRPSDAPVGGVPGGVEGGVIGGVVGGVQGGTLGGQIGGQIGGVLGGTPGGVVGGMVGGTPGGTGTEAPTGPLRVGGDVKAPRISNRVEPKYTEVARRARIQGIVIVEAIIDKNGNVDRVKVIRGLPMGLTESAVNAVKQWKFRPGTLNGRSVDVIFNLTVNFRLGADGPSISKGSSRPVAPEPEPEPVPEPQQPQAQEPQLPQPPQPAEPEPAPQSQPLPPPPGA